MASVGSSAVRLRRRRQPRRIVDGDAACAMGGDQARVAQYASNGILSGDGYLLEGHHLYAVYNAGGGRYVTRLARLDSTWSRAEVIADSAPGAAGSTPTTVARDRDRLLWVNSQLD